MNVKEGAGLLMYKCIDVLETSGPAGFSTKLAAQAHATYLFSRLLDLCPERYDVSELAGYAHLSCFCALDEPCHVDEIIKKLHKKQ